LLPEGSGRGIILDFLPLVANQEMTCTRAEAFRFDWAGE
jgi:hypothetical protein